MAVCILQILPGQYGSRGAGWLVAGCGALWVGSCPIANSSKESNRTPWPPISFRRKAWAQSVVRRKGPALPIPLLLISCAPSTITHVIFGRRAMHDWKVLVLSAVHRFPGNRQRRMCTREPGSPKTAESVVSGFAEATCVLNAAGLCTSILTAQSQHLQREIAGILLQGPSAA